MKQRKLVSILCAVSLAASLLIGCSGKQQPESETAGTGAKTESAKSGDPGTGNPGTESGEAPGTPLADLRVRQALAYAIDMDAIVETLFNGKAQAAKSYTAPGDWLNAEIPTYKYDPEKAKELLKEAGWPSDYTLDVVYYYDDPAGDKRTTHEWRYGIT